MARVKVGTKVYVADNKQYDADESHHGHKAKVVGKEVHTWYVGKPSFFKIVIYNLDCRCGEEISRVRKQLRQR